MTKEQEALKLALEALKVSRDMVVDQKYAPLGWSVTRFDEVLTTGKEALTQPEQLVAHREAFWCVDLTCKKCYGADFRFKHKSSVDKKSLTTPAQPEERNFCPRCGKRLASGFVEISIHKCTPPKDAR